MLHYFIIHFFQNPILLIRLIILFGLSISASETLRPPVRFQTACFFLFWDGRTNTSRVVPPEVKGAKKARLAYEVLKENAADSESQAALVRIRLYTGRHHQIRVQMANAGMPLLGDHKYAGEQALETSTRLGIREIALCAYRLTFCHPKTRKSMQFEIEPEGAAFRKLK